MCFLLCLSFFFFLIFLVFLGGFVFFVFFWRVKGSSEVALPHLALNPPYLFFVCFGFFFLVFLRATSLGPKPSLFYFLFGFFCLAFPFFASNRQKTLFFSLRKGHFLFIFECLPFFLLSLFRPLPFSVSLSLSLSLYLSLSFSFLFSFLSFFFAFFFFLVFLSFFSFLTSLFLFHERNNIKTLNCNFSIILSIFCWVSCLVFSFQSLSLIFVLFS